MNKQGGYLHHCNSDHYLHHCNIDKFRASEQNILIVTILATVNIKVKLNINVKVWNCIIYELWNEIYQESKHGNESENTLYQK